MDESSGFLPVWSPKEPSLQKAQLTTQTSDAILW